MTIQSDVTRMLETGLRLTQARQSTIANNIANLNTPHFRREEVRFEDSLREVIESGKFDELASLTPEVLPSKDSPVNENGNDVSLDREVGELVRNVGVQKTYARLLARSYRAMELAMQIE